LTVEDTVKNVKVVEVSIWIPKDDTSICAFCLSW